MHFVKKMYTHYRFSITTIQKYVRWLFTFSHFRQHFCCIVCCGHSLLRQKQSVTEVPNKREDASDVNECLHSEAETEAMQKSFSRYSHWRFRTVDFLSVNSQYVGRCRCINGRLQLVTVRWRETPEVLAVLRELTTEIRIRTDTVATLCGWYEKRHLVSKNTHLRKSIYKCLKWLLWHELTV